MKYSKSGFSLVEIIISVAILIILGVVGATSYQGVVDKSKNSLVESHLQTLKNTFLSYSNDTKILPYPSGNLKIYNTEGTYEHNFEDENTFGVSGFITSENIPKGYLQDTPIDPRNNQYYGYAHTKGFLGFQVSGVVMSNHEPKSKLASNWTGISEENKVSLPYLVKEYNGPRFITQDSTELFAYNPAERILTAKIHDFSGNITINDTPIATDQVKNYTLLEGDTLQVETGNFADIYYSDGSTSTLGDIWESSSITLSQMRYIEENNLFTNISIALNAGSLWTKAVKLADKSEFQVETPAAVAAVRGTIFGVRKSGNMTSIVVKEGIVEVGVKENGETIPLHKTGIADDGYIIVQKAEPEKGVDLSQLSPGGFISPSSSTGIIQKIPTPKVSEMLQGSAFTPININKPENICEAGFEKWNGECIEFIESTDDVVSGTGKKLFDLFQDVLQRKPDKKGFYFWLNGMVNKSDDEIAKIEKTFKSESYNAYLNKKERYFNPEYICEAQKSFTHDFECVENTIFKDDASWKVLAYAPFNEDLKMYNSFGSAILPSGPTHGSLLYQTGGLGLVTCQSGYANNTGNSSDYLNLNIHLIKLSPKLLYKNYPPIYQLSDIKGLFLDNLNCDDFLKYYPLSLSGSFIIETSVRGGALKRTGSGTYTLWQSNAIKLEKKYKNEGIILSLDDETSISQEQLHQLNDNDFYKVVAGFHGHEVFIKIYDKKNNLIVETSGSGSTSLAGDLYIGSTGPSGANLEYKNQWNDIIDYVKIYTK